MSVKEEIMAAHDRFYAALNEMIADKPRSMPDAWYHDDDATTTHPMGHWAIGWDQVIATWEALGDALSDGGVRVTDLHIGIYGDMAYTIGVEHVTFRIMGGEQMSFTANTTNIYRNGPEGWKMIHHHPDKAPEAEEAAAG
jgi:ketosteroid isomerase-like protein